MLIDLQKNNNSNYLPFLLQSDFMRNQVTMLVCKDFWYEELTRHYLSTLPNQWGAVLLHDLYIYGLGQGITPDG